MPTPFSKKARYLVVALSLLMALPLVFGAYAGFLQLVGNFHTVVVGELYRAAQPSPQQIADYKKKYNIQTIINLRGENTGSAWYDEEVRASKDLGIAHIDFYMSDKSELTQERAAELISEMRRAAKPILVHCRAGSDRSGLASALYLAAIGKKGEDASESQISYRYGHISIPFISASYAMDLSFEYLEEWLGFFGS